MHDRDPEVIFRFISERGNGNNFCSNKEVCESGW